MKTAHDTQRGFTLLEMIVALGVFAVVMVIAAGALLSILRANRETQIQRTVINNLNFAVDSMLRDIRVGTTYHCGDTGDTLGLATPNDCQVSGGTLFAFERSTGDPDNQNDQVVYQLNTAGTGIERSTDSASNFIAITSDEIVIERLRFYVVGSTPGSPDDNQPEVTVVIGGYALLPNGTQLDFDLQTHASQRAFDI